MYDRRGHTCRSRIEPLTDSKPIRKDISGQLPLAIAQLLISPRSHEQRRRYGDDTSSAPAHTSLAFGNQQDPILILRHVARSASRAFPVSVLLFPPRPQLLKPALEALSVGLLVGGAPRASVPSQQEGFRGVRSGSCVRIWEGGDSKIALSSSESML